MNVTAMLKFTVQNRRQQQLSKEGVNDGQIEGEDGERNNNRKTEGISANMEHTSK